MTKLALLGGTPMRDAKTTPWPKWPVWDEKEEKALLDVLNSGVWSYNGPKEAEFNKNFSMPFFYQYNENYSGCGQ